MVPTNGNEQNEIEWKERRSGPSTCPTAGKVIKRYLYLCRAKALEHNWVKAADFSESDDDVDDADDVDDDRSDRSDRSDSSLVIDEFDDEGGPPPGCMSKKIEKLGHAETFYAALEPVSMFYH